jgi:hypothetical protein
VGTIAPSSNVYGRPGYWTQAGFVELPHPGDGGNARTANAEIIIGQTFVVTPGVGITDVKPALWNESGLRTITGIDGVAGYSRDINTSSTYVGITIDFNTGTFGGFIGRDGSATRLNFPNFPETRVYEINDSDVFVGVYEPVNNQIVRGYVATHNLDTGAQTIRDLGLFPGYNQTWVYANNNDGYIVGGAYTGIDFDRALIWLPGSDTPLDLNTMVDLPGVTLIDAYRINNAGQILAEARLDAGGFAYYRLDPIIPEPAAMGLVCGLVLATAWRRSARR